MYAGKQQEDDHEQFAQAVQAIITSDESQSQSSSSGIAIEDDERSHGTISDRTNKENFLFDKYESHSSEDRDHSLEDLISRLIATQQQPNNKQYQSKYIIRFSLKMKRFGFLINKVKYIRVKLKVSLPN